MHTPNSAKHPVRSASNLTFDEKTDMVAQHEDGDSIYDLADRYGITPRSVAAYVANAHRGFSGKLQALKPPLRPVTPPTSIVTLTGKTVLPHLGLRPVHTAPLPVLKIEKLKAPQSFQERPPNPEELVMWLNGLRRLVIHALNEIDPEGGMSDKDGDFLKFGDRVQRLSGTLNLPETVCAAIKTINIYRNQAEYRDGKIGVEKMQRLYSAWTEIEKWAVVANAKVASKMMNWRPERWRAYIVGLTSA